MEGQLEQACKAGPIIGLNTFSKLTNNSQYLTGIYIKQSELCAYYAVKQHSTPTFSTLTENSQHLA